MSTKWQERVAGITLVVMLVLATVFGPWYDHRLDARLAGPPPASGKVHIFHLTGLAKPGMWTLDRVESQSYWRKTPERLNEIKVNLGDTVILTITSSDVEHGFVIPPLNIGPYSIMPGHTKVVRFVADRAGSFPFLCAKVCSCTGTGFACTLTKKLGHEGMTGALTVEEPMGPPDVTANITVSEDKGFEPNAIKVQEGQIVQLNVTSETQGTGQGVGFCITDYETKVDMQGIGLGETRSFKFRADKPGTFSIYSSTSAGPKIDGANGSFVVSPK